MSTTRPATPLARRLLALFLISGAAVGYEVALTRYFAVAKWSEYGYWVISIVMAGFALSGVTVALVRERATRHAERLLRLLPPLLVLAAAGGFWGTVANPFNPLQLQNPVTFASQLVNIALYYAALLPFFFLTGLYISLVFVRHDDRVGLVYGFDLAGAGAGAALVLLLMTLLHPFRLVPALLLPLALAGLVAAGRRIAVLSLLALVLAEAALLLLPGPAYDEFKPIYAPLHTEGARVLAEVRSPRGLYALLDDFTERVDVDLSNQAGTMGLPGPPAALGLYRDGVRIAALPRPGPEDARYAPATLDALAYWLAPEGTVLLQGVGGGFRVRQALALGAKHILGVEPDPVLLAAARGGLAGAAAASADPGVRLVGGSPLAHLGDGAAYGLIDLGSDFLDAAEANQAAFTAEALAADLAALAPGGILSVPVSIRELPAYGVRMLATVRRALDLAGVAEPARHVLVIRSAWSLRILVRREPWEAPAVTLARRFADARAFDLSYYPGMDAVAARANIYNDLPAVDFERGEVAAGDAPQDAIADEARAVLQGVAGAAAGAFTRAPVTRDRPAFYAVLRLARLRAILPRIEALPQPEIGQLVNLAVLAQAALLALLVLAVPLLAPRVATAAGQGGRAGLLRAACYFAALGLGFLFIEIVLIEKASLYLADRASAFALVLTGMLVFSGLGSLLADRVGVGRRGLALVLAGGVIVLWCGLALRLLDPLLLATIGLAPPLRAGMLLLVTAPVAVALGMPFPLGLARAGGSFMLPWAWGLNGAFSVVATPLANLIAVQAGFGRLLLAALLLYLIAVLSFPLSQRVRPSWQSSPLA